MSKLVIIVITLFGLISCSEGNISEIEINLEDNKFSPEIVEIKSGVKYKLLIQNHDNNAEEFESIDLKREKLIPANSKVVIKIGPLLPGVYSFFGDFHKDKAFGKIVVKE